MSKNDCDDINDQDTCNHAISRRALLVGAGALGAALATGASVAADAPGHRHENHAPQNTDALDAVNNCVVNAPRRLTRCGRYAARFPTSSRAIRPTLRRCPLCVVRHAKTARKNVACTKTSTLNARSARRPAHRLSPRSSPCRPEFELTWRRAQRRKGTPNLTVT